MRSCERHAAPARPRRSPARRGRARSGRRAAARRVGARRSGALGVRGHRRRLARRAGAARLRMVPWTQQARAAALRLRYRRVPRRARRRRRQRQRGCGVDARVPPRTARARRCGAAPCGAGTIDARGCMTNGLFDRSAANPILTADAWPIAVNAVFNPAAVQVGDETVLLARVEDRRGISHLTVARSANGVDGWDVDEEPLLSPRTGHEDEQWGFEDARAIWVEELATHVITCTAYGPAGPAVYMATSTDFRSVERLGIVVTPEDKNAALLPERVGGKWILFHRPTSHFAPSGSGISLSRSADLRSWSPPEVVMEPRDGAWWDSLRIGIGPPLVKTEHGWLLVYHGVKETVMGAIYRVGLALLDLDEPSRVLHRA